MAGYAENYHWGRNTPSNVDFNRKRSREDEDTEIITIKRGIFHIASPVMSLVNLTCLPQLPWPPPTNKSMHS